MVNHILDLVELVVLVVVQPAAALLVLVKTILDQLNKVIQVELEIPVVVKLVVAVVPVLLEEVLQAHQLEVDLEV